MKTRCLLLALALVVPATMFAFEVGAQEPPQPGQPPARVAGEPPPPPPKPDLDLPVPPEQLLAARLMAQKGLERLPEQLAKRYGLTDAQKESARETLQTRWAAMGQETQDALFRAIIYGRRLHRSGQATPEDWQRLANEALPALESSLKMLNGSADDFEKVLDPEQRAKFTEHMAGFRKGQQVLLTRAKLVAEGKVKLEANGQPADGWPEEAEFERRGGGTIEVVEEEVVEIGPDGVERRIKIRRIKSSLPDEKTVAGDEKYWTPFVKGFIVKFDLDTEQQKQAKRMLGESLRQARAYRERMKAPLSAARKRIAEAEAGDDAHTVEAAHRAYDQLNRPVAAIFRNLQRQLDSLLTPRQREAGKNRGELFGRPQAPTGSD